MSPRHVRTRSQAARLGEPASPPRDRAAAPDGRKLEPPEIPAEGAIAPRWREKVASLVNATRPEVRATEAKPAAQAVDHWEWRELEQRPVERAEVRRASVERKAFLRVAFQPTEAAPHRVRVLRIQPAAGDQARVAA